MRSAAMFQIIYNKCTKHFRKDEDGAVAIEFAVLALPFLMLVFGILELALVFFTNTSLNHAVKKASREIRTGQNVCQNIDAFKASVCSHMQLNNCTNNIAIQVQPIVPNSGSVGILNSFNAVFDPQPNLPGFPSPVMPTINPNQVVLVKARYRHNLILPGKLTFLATHGSDSTRVISLNHAMRTEPFPAGAACPVT